MLNIIDRRIWTAIGASALLAATALPAFAVDIDSTVTATVTPQLVALSIVDGAVDYEFLGASASKDTLNPADTQVVSNDGNVPEDFDVRGQDSASWTLAATPASEAYRHEFSITATFPGTPLTTSNQPLDTNVSTVGSTNLDLKITTPTVTAATVQQFVNVTVVATAN